MPGRPKSGQRPAMRVRASDQLPQFPSWCEQPEQNLSPDADSTGPASVHTGRPAQGPPVHQARVIGAHQSAVRQRPF
jgi:hypothetical protein